MNGTPQARHWMTESEKLAFVSYDLTKEIERTSDRTGRTEKNHQAEGIGENRTMKEIITFREDDRIAVVAPHPDDECIGVSAALIFAPKQTDIIVMTDGSHGNPEVEPAEEAKIRKRQFEAEMAIVGPRSWEWLGIEDTKLTSARKAAEEIDFRVYTKIFLPDMESLHPDHRAAAEICRDVMRRQKITAECFYYEVCTPFYNPTHYVDITSVMDKKIELIRCHEDQNEQEEMAVALNAFRASQLISEKECRYAECFLRFDPFDFSEAPDMPERRLLRGGQR